MLVMGYSNFDLGIFDDKDIKVTIIKKAIRERLISYIEQGLKWLIFTGNMGFEYWVLQESKSLQEEYKFQLAVIFDFETHGQNWNESNQMKLSEFKNLDYVKYAFESYENANQFRTYNDFLLDNSDGAFVFYDEENETKLKYMTTRMKNQDVYILDFLTFEDLQDIYEDMNN